MKKRKNRKRSNAPENNQIQENEKIISAEEPVSLIKKRGVYEYQSDFEDFEDDSSNDEGFGSEQLTSMSDSMSPETMVTSQFTPRLPTMYEEEEEIAEAEKVKVKETDYDSYENEDVEDPNYVLYEEDVEAYLKSEALRDGKVLQQVEKSWDVFLQQHVSLIALFTVVHLFSLNDAHTNSEYSIDIDMCCGVVILPRSCTQYDIGTLVYFSG